MIGFEDACNAIERAATTLAKGTAALTRAARQLEKAAGEGDVQKIKRALEQLRIADQTVRQEARNAESAWPYTDSQVEEVLRTGYEAELIRAAESLGLKIRRQDEHLVAFPSLVRIIPDQRAIRIDKTKVTAIRPSRVATELHRNQGKTATISPERFIETLYDAFKIVVRSSGATGSTLAEIYKVLTLMPGSSRDYTKSDFARDLYFLERSGVTTTRSGAQLSLPASTGTKGAATLFTFMGADGAPSVYYGIKFTEADR